MKSTGDVLLQSTKMSTGDVVVRQYHQLTFVTEQMKNEVIWRYLTTVNYNVNWRRDKLYNVTS